MGAATASRTAAPATAAPVARAPVPAFRASSPDAAPRPGAQRRVVAGGPAPMLPLGDGRQRALSGGSALAPPMLDRLERGFGADLSAVRVHEGAEAARLAQAHGARAFALGHHVVLGAGESSRDVGLMAHEVAHVLQQRGAAPAVQRCAGGCCDCGGGSALEGEAASAARSISSGGSHAVSGQLATATPQFEGEDEGLVSDLVWRTAHTVAPQLVPVLKRGPAGVLDWIQDKVSGAVQTVVDTAMAPVRAVTDSAKFLHTHLAPLLTSMQEAAARIAQNDCKPLTDAAAKIEDVATRLITPVIEKIQGVVAKVGGFLSGLWERFGTPVWEFLKQYAGEKWRQVQQLIDWVWDLARPIRDLSARAWTWLKNKIGIGDGPEGQNGILQWVQAKAKAAWAVVQAKIEPYKKKIQAVLLTVGAVALLVSPAGPFVLAGLAIYGAIQGVKWIRANLAGGNALVRARAHVQTVVIPQMIAAIQRMTAAVMKMSGTVTGKLGEFAAGLGAMVGAAAGSALDFLVGAAQWLADRATELAAWASEKLTALADRIQRAMHRLIEFLQPLLNFLAKVGALILDVTQLPLLLAGALWKKIPACIRDPFVDWIIPLILRQIEIFKELVKNDEAWAKTKATVMRIVRAVFVTRDLNGAIRATFDLLLQVFNLPIELLVQVKNKALAAWDVVSKKPIAFIKNAVKALGMGLQLYGDKLKDNLLAGLEGWLFGELADQGIAKPKSWTDPWDLVKLALDVLGLSMPHFFDLLEKRFEKETVNKLRTAWRYLTSAWDWILDMKAKKPGDVAKEIVQAGKEFGKSVLEGIVTWIMEQVALELTVMATAAAASAGLSEVVDAVRRIYRAIKTAVRWARQIVDMVNKTLDGVLDIAAGSLAGPAEIFNHAMKKATPAVIGFLGDQVGLSGVADTIRGLIDKLRAKVDNAILAIIDAVKGLFASLIAGAKSLAGKVFEWWKQRRKVGEGREKHTLSFQGDEDSAELTIESTPRKLREFLGSVRNEVPYASKAKQDIIERLDKRIDQVATLKAERAAAKKKNQANVQAQKEADIQKAFEGIGDLLNDLFKGDTYGTQAQPIPLDWYGPPISDYPPLYFGGPVNAKNPARRQSALKAMLGKPDGNGVIVKAYSPFQREALRDEKGSPMPTRTIGLNASFIIGTGRVLGPLSQETTQGGGKLGQLIEPYGYSGDDGYELDHVHEIQFGGLSANDRVENLWPLEARKNSSKGSALSKAEVEYPKNNKERVRIPTLKLMQGDPENKERFWFVIRSISPRT